MRRWKARGSEPDPADVKLAAAEASMAITENAGAYAEAGFPGLGWTVDGRRYVIMRATWDVNLASQLPEVMARARSGDGVVLDALAEHGLLSNPAAATHHPQGRQVLCQMAGQSDNLPAVVGDMKTSFSDPVLGMLEPVGPDHKYWLPDSVTTAYRSPDLNAFVADATPPRPGAKSPLEIAFRSALREHQVQLRDVTRRLRPPDFGDL